VPHPRELRLGLGWRLRDIDEEGHLALVGHVLGGQQVRELASKTVVAEIWPGARHNGRPVAFLSPMAVGPDMLVRRAATYAVTVDLDGSETLVYHDPLVALAPIASGQVQELRLVARPRQELAERLLLARDGQTAVLVSASRFDVIDLSGRRPAQIMDLKGEMMFDLAISSEMRLAVAAVFGRLRCFDLDSGQLRGSIRLEDHDVTAVALGGGHVAAVTAELGLHVRRAGTGSPEGWVRTLRTDVDVRGRLAPAELAVSHDGRLVALRHRRKQVLVIDLASGERQLLGGHTDAICFVRFVAGGRLLVTADDDNRVRFWPRLEDRIVTGG